MFTAARPPLIWSSDAKRRARLYGSLKVVEAVATRPTRSVTAAIAASTTVGSSEFHGRAPASGPMATPSARKIASSVPRSATCAQCW